MESPREGEMDAVEIASQIRNGGMTAEEAIADAVKRARINTEAGQSDLISQLFFAPDLIMANCSKLFVQE